MTNDKDLTQILNNFGPLRGNVEKQFIVTRDIADDRQREQQQADSKTDSKPDSDGRTATVKVRAKVLLELMKRSGMGLDKHDRTKVCRLAAFVLGSDYKSLLNVVGEGIRLNAHTHKDDVKQVNRLLNDLEAGFELDFG